MTTIDKRTRFVGPVEVMDAEQLFGDLAERLQETGALAARGVEVLDLPPLTFEVDGTTAHLVVADRALTLREGRAAAGPVSDSTPSPAPSCSRTWRRRSGS